MRINWNEAPSDATHAFGRVAFRKKDRNGSWYGWRRHAKEWVRVIRPHPERYVARPVGWNGEGLPPVGTVCEARIEGKHFWEKLTMKYRSLDFSVFEREDGNEFPLWNPQYAEFRPIRTAEQIAAEEREKACNEMASLIGRGTFFQDAEALYDAGYRKQVQSK